ncbi:MAG: hypothetical protein V8Q75_03000 [Bacilli bacterium]
MKKLLTFFNILMVGIVSFNIYTTEASESLFSEMVNDNGNNYIAYNVVLDDVINTELDEEEFPVVVEDEKETVVSTTTVDDKITDKKEDIVVSIPSNALETLYGTMSGYGPDCYGCTSNRVASGYYVGEGNIYYNDSTYGKVRIVSGDKKYPFGTIVKISASNVSDSDIIAIVLDRGGNIGIGKKFTFDLLFATEKDASKYSVSHNVKFEVLRLGY